MTAAVYMSVSPLWQQVGRKRANLRVTLDSTQSVEDGGGELASRFRAALGQVGVRGLKIQLSQA